MNLCNYRFNITEKQITTIKQFKTSFFHDKSVTVA